MKVMITKNSVGKNCWYANLIGNIFEVVFVKHNLHYVLAEDYDEDVQHFIDLKDCKEILDES